MYFITSVICNIDISGITVKSEYALNDVLMVVKLIFTPINAIILLAPLGNIFGKLYEANEKGQEEFPFTTGKNKLDFIHVDKLMEQIYRASLQSDINGIIEVCTGEPKSLAEQVEQFMKDKNMTIKLKYGVFPDRPYDSPCVYGDATKIKAIMAKES